MQKENKASLCFILSILILFVIYILFFIGGFFNKSTVIIISDFRFLHLKYLYYLSIYLMFFGYSYLHGDIEKDFNEIAVFVFIILICMDIGGIANMIKYILSGSR